MTTDTLSQREARRMLSRLIDEQVADRRDFYYTSRQHHDVRGIARAAVDAFGDKKSQMNKLERVALSASTYATIANYIKSQLGRDTSTGKDWKRDDFGYRLLEELDGAAGAASGDANNIIDAVDKALKKALDKSDLKKLDIARRLRVGYAQAFVGHVAAHYSYLVSQPSS